MPLFDAGMGSWFVATGHALISEKTLFLVAIVMTILALSKLLEITGQAERLMDALGERFHRPSLALTFFSCFDRSAAHARRSCFFPPPCSKACPTGCSAPILK